MQTITIAPPKRSWFSLLSWAVVLAVLVVSWQGAEMAPLTLIKDGGNMATFAADFFPPEDLYHQEGIDEETRKILSIQTYYESMWIERGKFHGIFTLAASQLQHDRVIIVEIHLTPLALHIERHVIYNTIWILEHVLETLHIRKLC